MYAIRFAPEVEKRDVVTLNREDEKVAMTALKRLQSADDPTCIHGEDITEMDRDCPGYFRWKPSKEIRSTCDTEIRVVFRVVENTIEVLCVRTRAEYLRECRNRSHTNAITNYIRNK